MDIYHCKEGEKFFLMEDLKAQEFKLCHDEVNIRLDTQYSQEL